MKIKTYFEEDNIGKHKVMEHSNGVKVKILVEPSESYSKKINALKEKQVIDQKKIEEEYMKNKLISDKMRELAIRELKKEGKL